MGLALLLVAALSRRLFTTLVTPAIVMVVIGVLAGPLVFDDTTVGPTSATVRTPLCPLVCSERRWTPSSDGERAGPRASHTAARALAIACGVGRAHGSRRCASALGRPAASGEPRYVIAPDGLNGDLPGGPRRKSLKAELWVSHEMVAEFS